jgi:hypothetical protein
MAISAQAIGSTSAAKKSAFRQPKTLPVPNSDFYLEAISRNRD